MSLWKLVSYVTKEGHPPKKLMSLDNNFLQMGYTCNKVSHFITNFTANILADTIFHLDIP